MTRPRDFWVLRATAISDSELGTLVASRTDLEPAGPVLGRTLDGKPIPLPCDGLYRWKDPNGSDDILISISSEGIHITEGSATAQNLAESFATALGGWVQEG